MPTPISETQLLAALNWRYAVKKFDPARKIPGETWAALEQSLVLTPSSMGMQPWKFFAVTDPAMKVRLRPAAKNQAQAVDSSHFVIFAVHRDLSDAHVSRHLDRMAEVRGIPRESLDKFLKMAMGNLDAARAEGTLDTWQKHQVYIALGTFMAAAALLGVDTCPMEGIDPIAMDDVLGMTGTSYNTVVACAAGYRAGDDKYASIPKVRFRVEDVVVRI
jgi:nitroreductase